MAALLLVSMFFVLASADASDSGMAFSPDSYYDQKKTIAPKGNITYEAEIWFSAEDAASTKPGLIASNYTDGTTLFALTIDVQKNGRIRLHTQHNDGSITDSSGKKKGSSSVTFDTQIGEEYVGTESAPKYVKIAVTVDTATGEASLYLNGEYKESKTNSYWKGYDFSKQDVPLRIGGDYRSGNTSYFRGKSKSIALYQDMRSAEEIAADAAKTSFSVDSSDPNLVYAYDLTDTSVAGLLKDLSGNGYDAYNPSLYVDDTHQRGFYIERENDSTSNYPDSTYDIYNRFTEIPETLEAWVYVPSSVYGSRIGLILGNYSGYTKDSHLNFELAAGGVPRIQWYGELNNDDTRIGQYDIKFTESAIPVDKWTHLAFVYDNETGITYCYLNGELSETKYFYPTIPESAIGCEYVLGGDNRNLNSQYFKGELGDITVYSDVRSAEEIKADYNKGMAMTKAELDSESCILYYDLDGSDVGKSIVDESGNGYDAIYSDTWITEEDMASIREGYGFESSYSFAVIGDTQYTTRKYPNMLPVLYKWIVNNKDEKNIQYVMGMGDITDANGKGTNASYDNYVFVKDESDALAGGYWVIDKSASGTEWDVAYHSITILDGNVEYSLVRGNHDILSFGNGFNEYFANHSEYIGQFIEHGGIYGYDGSGEITDATNTWRTFKIGEVKYLFMNLDYGANDSILAWASVIVDRPDFADHNVIITTHGYLYSGGSTLDLGDYGCPTGQNPNNNNGNDIWNEFVSQHANIQMILCGHFYYNNITHNQLKGVNGNTVTEMLIDAQAIDNTLKGLGVVAMFYFSEDGTKLAVEFYSTVRGEYYKTANQLVFDLEAEGRVLEEDKGWHGAAVAPAGKGTESDPYIINDAAHLLWMAEQVKASTEPTFSGKYFEQTADIDLNGLAIKSIGYMFASSSSMAAFGGIYDGNGYSIKNGTIEAADRSHAFTCDYGHGMFGVIYGATVKNIVLDNVEIVGAGVTGGIVGIAMSPKVSDPVYEGFNVIAGCELKSNVRIVTMRSNGTYTAPGFDDMNRAGRLGTVCGMAYGTVIDGCTSEVSFTFTGDFGFVGGIAGTVGMNTTVKNCYYGGVMTLWDNTATQTSAYGGIVGAISPTAKLTSDYAGYVHIVNCYNAGNFAFGDIIKNAGSLSKNTHWGGILGCASWITYSEPTEDRPYQFLIENCYNLSAGPERIGTGTKQVIGGIVAKSLTANTCSTLYVKDCYSVTVTNAGGDNGTNEYRYQGTSLSKDGEYAVAILGTVATKTAEELTVYVSGINESIALVRASEYDNLWYFGLGFPTVSPADNGDRYYDVTSEVYYISDGSKWVPQFNTDEVVITPYGIVPKEYTDATVYPIILFRDGVFIGGYNVFANGTDSGGVMSKVKALLDGDASGEKGSTVQVYFRGDATATGILPNVGQILGNVIFDLNGFTLTQTYSKNPLFNTQGKNWQGMDDASFTFINGNIVLMSNLLSFSAYGSGYANAAGFKTFHLSFNNITFSYAEGSSATEFLAKYGDDASTAGKTVAYDIEFTDCTFDLRGAPGITTLLNANDLKTTEADTNCIINIVVKGGNIITARADTVWAEYGDNGSSVVFEKSTNSGFTTLTLTERAETVKYGVESSVGAQSFVNGKATENGYVYSLIATALAQTDFTPLVSITLDRNLVLNVYVPAIKELVSLIFCGTEINIADLESVTVNGAEYFVIRTPLAASEAFAKLDMKATVKVGELSATKSYTFSTVKYAQRVLDGQNEIEKTLARDVLSYVRAAYVYFGATDNEAFAIVNELLGEGYDESNQHADEGSVEISAPDFKEVTFVLESTPAIRFYLADNADTDAYSFYAGGKAVKTEIGSDDKGAYVEIDVYAYAMAETVTYTVNGEAGGSYHIASYYNHVSRGTDAALTSLVDRMWRYFQSARAYRNSVIG